MEYIVIKSHCVGVDCGEFIKGDPLRRYEMHGNWCPRCIKRVYDNLKRRKKEEPKMPERFVEILRGIFHEA